MQKKGSFQKRLTSRWSFWTTRWHHFKLTKMFCPFETKLPQRVQVSRLILVFWSSFEVTYHFSTGNFFKLYLGKIRNTSPIIFFSIPFSSADFLLHPGVFDGSPDINFVKVRVCERERVRGGVENHGVIAARLTIHSKGLVTHRSSEFRCTWC